MCVKSWRNSALFELTNFNFGAQLAGKWHHFAHKPRSNSTDHAHTLFLVAAKVVKILEIAHTHTLSLSLSQNTDILTTDRNGNKQKKTFGNLGCVARHVCCCLEWMDESLKRPTESPGNVSLFSTASCARATHKSYVEIKVQIDTAAPWKVLDTLARALSQIFAAHVVFNVQLI